MRMLRDGRCGFVLVELVAVVLLLVVLGTVMVVSAQLSRRDARLSNCVSNLKQHAIGMYGYAAGNGDTMPNGPRVPRGLDAESYRFLGQPGAHARAYSGPSQSPLGDVIVNGWQWEDPIINVLSPASDETLNANTYANLQTHNAYWHVLGEYMVEGEGFEALQDVFLSPADEEGAAAMGVVGEAATAAGGGALANDGVTGIALARLPSYRYTVGSMTRARIYQWSKDGAALGDPRETYNTLDQIASNVRAVPMADVHYPSEKVAFYLWPACHDEGKELWFEEGAEVTVGVIDGSARSVVPSDGAIGYSTDAEQRYRGAGPYYQVRIERNGANALTTEVEGNEVTGADPAYFWITNGGIRGRDLK